MLLTQSESGAGDTLRCIFHIVSPLYLSIVQCIRSSCAYHRSFYPCQRVTKGTTRGQRSALALKQKVKGIKKRTGRKARFSYSVTRSFALGRTRASMMPTPCDLLCDAPTAALDGSIAYVQPEGRSDHVVRSCAYVEDERFFFGQPTEFCKALPLIRRDLVKLILPAHSVTLQSLSRYPLQSCPGRCSPSHARCLLLPALSDQ